MNNNWQYFKPEERPRIINARSKGNAICFQIGNGPVREYFQINQIDDVYHMICKDFELQVKRHNNYGIHDDYWTVRAVEYEFAHANPTEFGIVQQQATPAATSNGHIPF